MWYYVITSIDQRQRANRAERDALIAERDRLRERVADYNERIAEVDDEVQHLVMATAMIERDHINNMEDGDAD